MFDLSSLQYNSEHPGLETAIYTALFAIVLGILLVFTYENNCQNNQPMYEVNSIRPLTKR